MPAIAVHHTETSTGGWDGPANEARLKTDGSEAYYRSAFAWQDPDGDPETKSAYKFIHHEVDGDGNVGPANVRACSTGIGVLNGGRGGTSIPASDRRGVWRHLAAHIEDAGEEPPELKFMPWEGIERRTVELDEIRMDDDETERTIVGHAALFNTFSVDLGGFREQIAPSAFRKTLKDSDVRALFNHNPDYVLGRTKAGTLKLKEDDIGLAFKLRVPDTSWARDLLVSMERGDINQMSFGFRVVKDSWDEVNGEVIRTLLEVRLFDVSIVTFPAYPQTEAQIRSLIDALQLYLPGKEPPSQRHSSVRQGAEPPAWHSAARERELELAKRLML